MNKNLQNIQLYSDFFFFWQISSSLYTINYKLYLMYRCTLLDSLEFFNEFFKFILHRIFHITWTWILIFLSIYAYYSYLYLIIFCIIANLYPIKELNNFTCTAKISKLNLFENLKQKNPILSFWYIVKSSHVNHLSFLSTIHEILYLYTKRTIDFSSTIFYGYRKIFGAEKFCGEFQLHEETFVTATLFASRVYFTFLFFSFNNKTFFNLKIYHILFRFFYY